MSYQKPRPHCGNMIYSLTALHKRHSQKLISNIQVHIFQFYLVQGCRNGFKNLIFSFFLQKNLKTLKIQILVLKVFLKKNLNIQILDSLSQQMPFSLISCVYSYCIHSSLHMAINVAGKRGY